MYPFGYGKESVNAAKLLRKIWENNHMLFKKSWCLKNQGKNEKSLYGAYTEYLDEKKLKEKTAEELKFEHSDAFRKCTSPYKWLIWGETIAASVISDVNNLNPSKNNSKEESIIKKLKQLLPDSTDKR